MTGHSEHGGGEKAMRDEVTEAEREEDRRVERVLDRWRTVIRNLKEMADGQD